MGGGGTRQEQERLAAMTEQAVHEQTANTTSLGHPQGSFGDMLPAMLGHAAAAAQQQQPTRGALVETLGNTLRSLWQACGQLDAQSLQAVTHSVHLAAYSVGGSVGVTRSDSNPVAQPR